MQIKSCRPFVLRGSISIKCWFIFLVRKDTMQMRTMCCFGCMTMDFPVFMRRHKALGYLKKEEVF